MFLLALFLYLPPDCSRNLLPKHVFCLGYLCFRNSSSTRISNYLDMCVTRLQGRRHFTYRGRKCWHNIMDVWEALTHSAEDNGWDLDWDQEHFIRKGLHSICSVGQDTVVKSGPCLAGFWKPVCPWLKGVLSFSGTFSMFSDETKSSLIIGDINFKINFYILTV